MKNRSRAVLWLAAGVVLGGAKGEDAVGVFLGVGLLVAFSLLASMPFGLLLHAWRPALVARVGDAYGKHGTAALFVGAGVLVAQFLVVAILLNAAPPLGFAALMVCYAYLLIGFAGCSRRQGIRLLGLDEESEDAGRPRPLVLGWLARAGATATPILWPAICVHLAASALGAPLMALLERRREARAGSAPSLGFGDASPPTDDL